MVREIISIDVGQCGIQIGQKLWKQYITEHEILFGNDNNAEQKYNETNSSSKNTTNDSSTSFQTLFEETKDNIYIARNLMVDLEPNVIDDTKSLSYSSIFNPSFLINGKEDAANNFARGMYSIGSEIIDSVMEAFRKSSEKCDNLQGFIMNHSNCGGTGSGLGCLILQRLHEDYRKKSNISFTVYPSEHLSTSPVEVYNALLSHHYFTDHTNVTTVLDNASLYGICQRNLDIKRPDYTNINKLIAKCVSSITCGLRFKGELNNSLDAFQTNLVPFPKIHFMLSSMAPVSTETKLESINADIKNITSLALEPESMLVEFDNYDPDECYWMAMSLQFRGNVNVTEVNDIPQWLKKERKALFVDWQPNGCKIGITDKPPAIMDDDDMGYYDKHVTMIGNHYGIFWKFQDRIRRPCDLMYSQRAFVHWYVGEGMEEGEFEEARESVGWIQHDYNDAMGYGPATDSEAEEYDEDDITDDDENA